MNPLSTGLMVTSGIQAGSQLLGIDPASRAMRRERDYLRRMNRRRMQFAQDQGIMGLLSDIRSQADALPQAARRRFESGMASFAQEEQNRIQEAMGQAGITGASDTAARQRRMLGGDIYQRQLSGEQQLAQMQMGAKQQALGAAGNVMNLLYPSAGQTFGAQANSIGQYTDPMSTIMNTLLAGAVSGGGITGGPGRGGSTGGYWGQVSLPDSAYSQLPI